MATRRTKSKGTYNSKTGKRTVNASVRRASQRVKDARAAGFKTTSKYTASVRSGHTARPESGSTDLSSGEKRAMARKLQGGTAPLTSESLKRVGSLTIPKLEETPAPDITANLAGLTGGEAGLTLQGNRLLAPQTGQSIDKTFQDYMAATASNSMPDGAAIQRKLERESGLREAQQAQNNYAAQLNTIIANRDANKLKLEGQGRGVTDTIIGGQQARIDREAAIQALPVQALLAEAQGNVALAKDHINTWGSILMQDAQNKYNQRNQLYKAAWDFANEKEKRRLAVLDRENERAYEDKRTNISLLNDWAKTAISYGQSSVAGQFMRLDPTSKTFSEDFARVQGQVRKPVAATGSTGFKAPTIKKINGVDMQWDAQTGTWVDPTTGGAAPKNLQQLAGAQANIETISNVLESPALDSTVGTSFLTRSGKGFFGTLGRVASLVGIPTVVGGAVDSLTGSKQNFIGDVKQMQSQLSLDSLINAKANGATFGALSEKELELLSKSATKLTSWEVRDSAGNTIGYNASEKAFKKEMDNINNAAKLDYLLKGGDPIDIGVRQQPDGTYWTQNSDGSFTQLQ